MNQYYVMIRDEWRGPVDLEEIERMFDAGEVSSRTMYAKEGWPEGRELGEILATRSQRGYGQVAPKQRAKNKPSTATTILGAMLTLILIVCSLGGILGSCGGGHSGNMDFDAYFTAEKFIKQKYPGAKGVSDYHESVVQHDGNTYTVAVTVDGLNAFGGPVRKQVGVQMTLNDGTWRLENIEQR